MQVMPYEGFCLVWSARRVGHSAETATEFVGFAAEVVSVMGSNPESGKNQYLQ